MIHATTWVNLENIMLSERSQTQRPYVVWLYLYEMSRIGKSTETESRLVVARAWGVTASWVTGFFESDENVQQLYRGDGCTTLWNVLKATELHTLKCLKWWISCYMNFTSKKVRKKLGCVHQLRVGPTKLFYGNQSGTYGIKPHGGKTGSTSWTVTFFKANL